MLDLGGNEIDCYVLGDGTRVLSSGSTTKAIADVDRGRLQDYIGQNALNPYINIDKILQEIIKFSMPGTQWPGLVATGMWGRDEQETLRKLKEWNQPIHGAGLRRSSVHGSAATACAECDGEVSPKPPSKSTSPPSPTTSNEHSISCNLPDEAEADTRANTG
jgi:hypothetical protein